MTVPAVGPPTSTAAEGYATDGDGDGIADVWNPADAIAGAARLLRANGAPGDYRRAVFAYNPSDAYVDRVLAKAEEYRGAFAPGATGGAQAVLAWAVAHVGRFTYSLGPPTDRGGSVQDMQSREPAGSTCDCSMFARWAFAQAGIDIGLTTSTQWTANGLLPSGDTPQATPQGHPRRRRRSAAGRLPARRPDLLRRRRRPRRSRRALARRRSDRPVLLERRRLEHPAARGLRRADGLGPLGDLTQTRWRRFRSRSHGRLELGEPPQSSSLGMSSSRPSAASIRARSPTDATAGEPFAEVLAGRGAPEVVVAARSVRASGRSSAHRCRWSARLAPRLRSGRASVRSRRLGARRARQRGVEAAQVVLPHGRNDVDAAGDLVGALDDAGEAPTMM